MSSIQVPGDVQDWLRDVFSACNARITEKLSNNPNIPEESLDLTWIEHLSRYSSPVTLPSAWIVKIETHYLGGLRHFRRWEIADIGILLFIRRAGVVELRKVALLQSKRLYPTSDAVIEETQLDYEIGFARLADPEDLSRSLSLTADFEFTGDCRYGELSSGSDQTSAIAAYERENGLSVYYQLYNPWQIPFVQRIPLVEYTQQQGSPPVGARILPAPKVHALLNERVSGYRPKLRELARLVDGEDFGWRLEYFVVDLFLNCQEGSTFETWADGRISNLFYRRTGPIAAAISIVIESPGAEG